MPQFTPTFDLVCVVKQRSSNKFSIKIQASDVPTTELEAFNKDKNSLKDEIFRNYENVSDFIKNQLAAFKALAKELNITKVKICLICKQGISLKQVASELNNALGTHVSIVFEAEHSEALAYQKKNSTHQIFLTSV